MGFSIYSYNFYSGAYQPPAQIMHPNASLYPPPGPPIYHAPSYSPSLPPQQFNAPTIFNSAQRINQTVQPHLSQNPHADYTTSQSNQDSYEGTIQNGLPEGYGKAVYKKTGIEIDGHFKKGNPHEWCFATYPDGSTLYAYFEVDEATCAVSKIQGTIKFANEDRFQGTLEKVGNIGWLFPKDGRALYGHFKYSLEEKKLILIKQLTPNVEDVHPLKP